MRFILQKPDTIGAVASTLCIIHCLATPFLFIVNTCSLGGCASTPIWWKNIDFLFLVISFFSIYRSTKTTTNTKMKPLLWSNWSFLVILILNEKLQLFSLPEMATYITAFSLAAMHIYNLKYCQCSNDTCCTQNR